MHANVVLRHALVQHGRGSEWHERVARNKRRNDSTSSASTAPTIQALAQPTAHLRTPADDLMTNDVDRVMQSGPRRQMQDERAAGVFDKFKLNPRVVSIEMDANHARGPLTAVRDERSLIERSEPTVRHSHLVVQTERPWRRWRVLRRKETGGVSVNGRKLHDSSVCVCRMCVRCAPITADGASTCWMRAGSDSMHQPPANKRSE